jgi:hypothetical protein
MIQRTILLLIAGMMAGKLASQPLHVYPGDVNNNGVVNNVDFLYMGLAYNFGGPARSSESTAFTPQNATPWPFHFANGVNFAYADCNGDGIVNYYYDAFPIYVNYGMKHDSVTEDVFPVGHPSTDPSLRLGSAGQPIQTNPGVTLTIPISLGDAQHPLDDFYGLAFALHVDPAYVDASKVKFNFSQNSWANPDNDRVYMYKAASNSRVDVGWVRTDHNNVGGYGEIGDVQIIIIVDVIEFTAFPVRIDSILVIDKFGNTTAIAGDTLHINVQPFALSSGQTPLDNHYFNVQPNPASDILYLEHDADIDELLLSDPLGRTVLELQPHESKFKIPLPKLPAGLYLLKARSRSGTYLKKIRIQP